MLGEEELELVLHQLRRLAVNLNEQVGVADHPRARSSLSNRSQRTSVQWLSLISEKKKKSNRSGHKPGRFQVEQDFSLVVTVSYPSSTLPIPAPSTISSNVPSS